MTTTMTAPPSHDPCVIVHPDIADAWWLVDALMEPLLSASQTRGELDIVRTTAQPNGGPPPHRHAREDELFYIIDGTFEFVFADTRFTAKAGTAVFLPRGVVHTYKNVGDAPGRLFVIATPSGFVDFFMAAGEVCLDRSKPPQIGPATFEKLSAGCARFGVELLPTHVADMPAAALPKPRDLWVIGMHVRILLGEKDTHGMFSVAEGTAYPGEFVPPHRHLREDEIFYVLEGTFEFDTPDGVVTAPAGTLVYVPKMAMHGFRNSGQVVAKVLTIHTPGGFEHFFEAAGTPCTDLRSGPPKAAPDMQRLTQIFREHGMEL